MTKRILGQLTVPEDVTVEIAGNIIKVNGPQGSAEREIKTKVVDIVSKDNSVVINRLDTSKRGKMIANTWRAHIKNMFIGVKNNFTYKLKICSSHFPMNVSVDKGKVVIKNFMGGKIPRQTPIPGGVNVNINGDIITVESADIEKAGGLAGSIELLTRRTGFDRRRFQDGCYIM